MRIDNNDAFRNEAGKRGDKKILLIFLVFFYFLPILPSFLNFPLLFSIFWRGWGMHVKLLIPLNTTLLHSNFNSYRGRFFTGDPGFDGTRRGSHNIIPVRLSPNNAFFL